MQYKAVYNMSFALASTMATTMVLWVRLHCREGSVQKWKYDAKPSGWTQDWSLSSPHTTAFESSTRGWALKNLFPVRRLPNRPAFQSMTRAGTAIMIISCKLIVTGDLSPHWISWFIPRRLFMNIVFSCQLALQLLRSRNIQALKSATGKVHSLRLASLAASLRTASAGNLKTQQRRQSLQRRRHERGGLRAALR